MEAISGQGMGRPEHGSLVSLSVYLILLVLKEDTGFSSWPNLTSIKVKKKESDFTSHSFSAFLS